MENKAIVTPPKISYGLLVYDLASERIVFEEGNNVSVPEGLGCVLLISLAFELLAKKKMHLTDSVKAGKWVLDEKNTSNSLGLLTDETVDMFTAICAFLINSAPDAGIAISDYIRGVTAKTTLGQMQTLAKNIGLNDTAVRNITGRTRTSSPQHFTVEDICKVGKLLFSVPDYLLKLLSITQVIYKDKVFSAKSSILATKDAVYGMMFGEKSFNGMIYSEVGNKPYLICICNAKSNFDRDYHLSRALMHLQNEVNASIYSPPIKVLENQAEITKITIAADTYMGEFYTKQRQAAGKKDPLTEHGYYHSFAEIEPLLKDSQFNIVNLEAVLTNRTHAPYKDMLTFVLRGSPEHTTKVLKQANIHAVMLANNHAMDYGTEGLKDMLAQLDHEKLIRLGAGYNLNEAEEPLRIRCNGKELVIFNVYQYREFRHLVMQYYALGQKAGVACLDGGLLTKIKKEKKENSSAFIVVSPHWGSDYVHTSRQQYMQAQAIVNAGADLILGHGPHIMSHIDQIDGKYVLYSMGNFVFNSNGEYKQRDMPSYSFVSQIILTKNKLLLRLYPIQVNNKLTFWQPRFLNKEEFDDMLRWQNLMAGKNKAHYDIGNDQFGFFMQMVLD